MGIGHGGLDTAGERYQPDVFPVPATRAVRLPCPKPIKALCKWNLGWPRSVR